MCTINTTGIRADIITKGLLHTASILKVFFFGTFVSLSIFAVMPIYAFLFKNELVGLIPFEVPYLDQVGRGFIVIVECEN